MTTKEFPETILFVVYRCGQKKDTLLSEEDKRATTNVQNGLVFFFFIFHYLFVALN